MKTVNRSGREGFTLIELLVVVGIILILTGIVTFALINKLKDARQMATKAEIKALEFAIEEYKIDLGSYPPREHLVKALQDKLGASIKWHGPYRSFESGRLGSTDGSGRLINRRNTELLFHDGSSAETVLLPKNAEVVLDHFDRPIVYIPARDYEDAFSAHPDNETGFYNPQSFQLFSFGLDGRSSGDNPGSLLWDDNLDNNNNGLVDKEDNPKMLRSKGFSPTSTQGLPEDDVSNF